MIVYHGSNVIVERPDVIHSYRPLDFGKGFYVTSNYKQAELWSIRKSLIVGKGKPTVNIYQMSEDRSNLLVKSFAPDLIDWIDFVCACRDGSDVYKKFDLIITKEISRFSRNTLDSIKYTRELLLLDANEK